MMAKMTFECRDCRYVTTKYNAWRKHLLDETHQIQGRERSKKWTGKDLKKAVVVFGLFAIKKKSDVLRYFGDLAFVTDFVFWKDRPDFCIVQFLTTKFRENIIAMKPSIHGLKLFLRPREKITKEEWFSICPFLAINGKTVGNAGENSSTDQFNNSSDEEDLDSLVQNIDIRVREDIFENPEQKNAVYTEEPMEFENEEWKEIERGWNEQLDDLYNQNLMSPIDWELRNQAKTHVEKLLKSAYPNCVLISYGFGSSPIASGREKLCLFLDVNGYTNSSSHEGVLDMDISFEQLKELKSSVLLELTEGSRKHKLCSNILDKKGQWEIEFECLEIKCQLGLIAVHKAQCCRIVQFLCKLDHRVRPLLTVVHYWAVQHTLLWNNSCPTQGKQFKYLHPIMLQWLVIFYLIHQNILPSINWLQKRSSVSIMADGVSIGFCSNFKGIEWRGKEDYEVDHVTGNPTAKCILTLARETFKFMGDLELKKYVMSPNSGELIPIDEFRNTPDLNNRKRRRKSTYVFLQHPLNLSLNTTSLLGKAVSMKFTSACRRTCQRLELLLSERRGNAVDELNSYVPETLSKFPISTSRYENVHRINGIPNVPVIIEVINNKKKLKQSKTEEMESFCIKLHISKDFVAKSVPVKEPKMKKALANNLSAVWLEYLKEFNSLVWPICFGIKISPLPDCDNSTKFKGEIIDPVRFYCGSQTLKNININATTNIAKMLKYARTAAPLPDLEYNHQLLGPTKDLSFVCELLVNPDYRINGCTKLTGAQIKLTKMNGTVLKSAKCRKKFKQTYTDLWKIYSIRRLFSSIPIELD